MTVIEARANLDRIVRSGVHIGSPEYRSACDAIVAAASRAAFEEAAREADYLGSAYRDGESQRNVLAIVADRVRALAQGNV